MKLNARTNEYDHKVVDCPFCPKWLYVREIYKASPDPLRDLKRHITTEAKNEAFAKALTTGRLIENGTLTVPHLMYYLEHTKEVPVAPKVSTKRQYDADLTI